MLLQDIERNCKTIFGKSGANALRPWSGGTRIGETTSDVVIPDRTNLALPRTPSDSYLPYRVPPATPMTGRSTGRGANFGKSNSSSNTSHNSSLIRSFQRPGMGTDNKHTQSVPSFHHFNHTCVGGAVGKSQHDPFVRANASAAGMRTVHVEDRKALVNLTSRNPRLRTATPDGRATIFATKPFGNSVKYVGR